MVTSDVVRDWPAAQEIATKVREFAGEYPDHKYFGSSGTAVYVRRDRDGVLHGACLIGAALAALGVDPERLAGVNSVSVLDLLASDPDTATVEWLGVVQRRQDQRMRWVSVIACADKAVG